MTIIVIAIVVAIAAIVFGIFFIPGVGSALAMGLGLAFFKTLAAGRADRVKARQERRDRWRNRHNPQPAPEPTPEEVKDTLKKVDLDFKDEEPVRPRPRLRIFRRDHD